MEWNKLSLLTKINILAEQSTVMPSLLVECDELLKAVKNGTTNEECLKIINENF